VSFGRNLDLKDIYNHITLPEEVYLLRNRGIQAMASYANKYLADKSCLIVEGVAINPDFQGRGIFASLTSSAIDSQDFICLRTQNPRMYRALEKICDRVFPGPVVNFINSDKLVIEFADRQGFRYLLREFADYLKCNLDSRGVVRGYYGQLFYGEEPKHCRITNFFKQDLKMDLSKGDAVLLVGSLPKRYGQLRPAWVSDLD
jgi:hypothetical protein